MKVILSLFGLIFLLSSCIKNNPDPSWIQVNEWQLIVNPDAVDSAGVLSENITDAWVYVDNDLIGVFEVPFKIPVLVSGSKEIRIYPTIQNNGISATKKIYPFLEVYKITADLVQNEVLVINPTTQYDKDTKFWIEDFDGGTIEIEEGPASLVNIFTSSDPLVFDSEINGGEFGRVILDATNNIWVASTTANNFGTLVMNLPKGQECYLEIDYHTTNNVITGVLAISNSGQTVTDNPNIQINAQAEPYWKKIYIDLREVVSGSTSAEYFEFSFQAPIDEGETSGVINIDNIKAVYF